MKNMKKLFGIFLSMSIVASSFAGCSGGNSAANGQSAVGENERGKAIYWTWLSAQQGALDEYYKIDDSVEFELIQMNHEDIKQKLLIALSAGSGAPDLFQLPLRHFQSVAKTEKLMDVTSYIEPSIDQFSDTTTSILHVNDKYYGMAPDVCPAVLWYRQDIFDENGIGQITTWGEFEEAAKILKKKDIYMMPIFNPAGTWGANAIGMYLQSRGVGYFDEDGKVIQNNADLEYVLKWLYNMSENGYGEKLTFYSPEFWGEYKSGKIATLPANIAEGANIKKNMPELSGKWSVLPFPRWDDKEEALTGYWGGTAIGISNDSPVKEQAAKYAQWLCTTTEGQKAMYFSWGSVPSNEVAIKDKSFKEPDEYFSNKVVLDQILPSVPVYYNEFAIVESVVGEQIDLMFAGSQDPTTTARNIEQGLANEIS